MNEEIRFLKKTLLIQHIKGSSAKDTVAHLFTVESFKEMLEYASKDYSSLEECVEKLTAEALLENESDVVIKKAKRR